MGEVKLRRGDNLELVHHPNHYGGDVEHEHIKCVTAWGLGYRLGNATKYIARCGKKIANDDGAKKSMIKDLRKAIEYIQFKITLIEEDRDQIQS